MPSRWTFTIRPIKTLLKDELTAGLWIDPFAGFNSPAKYTNDIMMDRPTTHHLDALAFLKSFDNASIDGVLYDPPYSITQARKYGKTIFASMRYWKDLKDQIARILKPTGKVICFGWSSNGMGLKRGFTMTRLLCVPHGGSKNDTLVTVEIKNA